MTPRDARGAKTRQISTTNFATRHWRKVILYFPLGRPFNYTATRRRGSGFRREIAVYLCKRDDFSACSAQPEATLNGRLNPGKDPSIGKHADHDHNDHHGNHLGDVG